QLRKKVAAMPGDARGVARRVGRGNRDQLGEQREQLALHQPTLRMVSRAEVTAAVVLSRLRGAGAGIFCFAGLPQPGSATMRPASITTRPRTMVRTGPPCTWRPCHGVILLLEKSCDWSIAHARFM